MIPFENTEIAFRMKSDRELDRASFLFRALARPGLVRVGSSLAEIATRLRLPVSWIIKPTVFRHFCGGTTLFDCQPVVESLARFGVYSILDYSVEGKETEEDFEAALEETLASIRFAASHSHIPFAVFKPTGFTRNQVLAKASNKEPLTPSENAEAEAFKKRIDTLCKTAYDAGKPILIDAEDYCYQAFIDEVVVEMMKCYNHSKAIVFNTYQMYRIDRLEFLKHSYENAVRGKYFLGAKFVRGAYMEKERARAQEKGYESPIQPDKESTDRDYNAALEFSIEHLDIISVFNGSHNEESAAWLAKLTERKQIRRNDPRIWTSQLLGMSDHISFNMAHLGYNIAKYVPYGPVRQVLPYLMRRAEENTSVAGQTGRELRLIEQERRRRKYLRYADQ